MIDVIDKLNTKVNKLQKNRSSEGYVNGRFPSNEDMYPVIGSFGSSYWKHVWHTDRGIEYYRIDDLWLSKQIFISTTLAKSVGKIFLDLEYYSYIESISIRIDDIIEEDDILYILINDELIQSVYINQSILNIDFNRVLMLGDYLTVYRGSDLSGIIQIKYRIIG